MGGSFLSLTWNNAMVWHGLKADKSDLQTMEYKLENNHYASIDDFLNDAHLIFTNCRRYNGEKSTYTTQANKLEKALERIMRKRNLS
jgi:histone acetyltransferase